MIEKVFSVDIEAARQRVWHEITRTDQRCRPMFGTILVTTLKPGAPLRYRSMDGRFTFVAGEIVEVAAPKRLVHTFSFPNLDDPPTLVTWELTEVSGGTRVTVTHARFPGEESPTYRAVYKSWPKILGLFKEVIEKGDVGRGTKFGHAFLGALSFMLPKQLRTENVEAWLVEHPPRLK